MSQASQETYSLEKPDPGKAIIAPNLPYQPRDPQTYRPRIGLIACGGITATHLRAYKNAGYDVAVLCDLNRDRAEKRQAEFYPDADITTDYRDVLGRDDIAVVDIATHPQERLPLLEAALRARKHVLSQKPFVLNLDDGERLCDLADAMGVRLAVNQNGRWAPHFSYMREAVRSGLIGDVLGVHVAVHWDHTGFKNTPFEDIDDLVLYDFAIHWFDFVSTILGGRTATRVSALRSRALHQEMRPPMLASALVEFPGGQSSLVFDAHTRFGSLDTTYIAGSHGSLSSVGPNLGKQTLTLYTADGTASPELSGTWFPDGFHGTMAELLCAIEENRQPTNNVRENLRSLALCFAAIASAHDGTPKNVGEVRTLPGYK